MNINKLLKAKNEEDLGFPLQQEGAEKRNESFALPLSTSYKVDNTQDSEFGATKEANSMKNAFYRPAQNTTDMNNHTMFQATQNADSIQGTLGISRHQTARTASRMAVSPQDRSFAVLSQQRSNANI